MENKSALLVVDVQKDFCPGGALEVPDGDRVVPVINRYMEFFRAAGLPVLATRDWHPEETIHFEEQGGGWPPHCVKGTEGAEFHPGLNLGEGAIIITKGDDPGEDAYSGFDGRDPSGTPLEEALESLEVERLYVCGLATDYCVRQTVLDALERGFAVTVLADAIAGVEMEEGDSEKAVEEMKRQGAEMGTMEGFRL